MFFRGHASNLIPGADNHSRISSEGFHNLSDLLTNVLLGATNERLHRMNMSVHRGAPAQLFYNLPQPVESHYELGG